MPCFVPARVNTLPFSFFFIIIIYFSIRSLISALSFYLYFKERFLFHVFWLIPAFLSCPSAKLNLIKTHVEDNKLWTIKVEFIAPERADYMPRLCGSSEGNDDTALDPANKKLTTNRFAANTTTNKTKKRKGPAIRCFVGTDPTSTILGLLRKPLLSTSDSF